MSSSPSVGLYGEYGGRYVPETLIPALDELARGWDEASVDASFRAELDELLERFAGRPTPLYEATRFVPAGKRIFLKREDLLHTGAHKINNTVGQALLAVRLGKRRIVAETGAGQHGVATATVCARFGLECVVYMGSEDMRRQRPNVERMGLLGAEVRPVEFGTRTLKEATSEAIRDWISNVHTTYYLIGSCVGPHPYPVIVRELQAVIGREARVADPRAAWTTARRRDCVRRRRLQRDRPLRRASSPMKRCGSSGSRPRAQQACPRGARACSTALARRCSRTRTVRFSTPTRSLRDSTIPESARSTRTCATPAAPST